MNLILQNPYSTGGCMNCVAEKVDKLIVWEPSLLTNVTKPICVCSNSSERIVKPLVLTSLTDNVIMEMQVDPSVSAINYFKANFSLFEASYKFVHGPLCGPPILKAALDGELRFPYQDVLSFIEPPRTIHCVWDIQVNEGRDLSLSFEKVKFVSRDCQDGRLDIYLPSRIKNPFLTVCGHNVSALKNIGVITSEELIPKFTLDPHRFVQLHFTSQTTPSRAAIKVVWTELFHLSRTSSASKTIKNT